MRATLPENPAARRARLQAEWGISDFDMQSVVNAGALDLVEQTVAAGLDQAAARKWWLGELARLANESGGTVADLTVTPAQVIEGRATDHGGHPQRQAGRQVFAGIISGEGDADEVVAARGLDRGV